ncbi:hypothetical protein ACXZ66_13050 [Corynebacterium sp. S7]
MQSATYRQHLRVAEVCKSAGDLSGCEQALGKFLSHAMPIADSIEQSGQRDVYTDIAIAATELIHLQHGRQELQGAATVAERVVAFFAGSTYRLERVDVAKRAALMFVVASHSQEPQLKANLYGAAGLDFAQVGVLEKAAQARINESRALFQLQEYRTSHEQALLASRLARQAGSIELEIQAVEQLSQSFLKAGDAESAIGILQEMLQREELASSDMDAIRWRAEVTESIARRYLALNNKQAARAACKHAANLYSECGEHVRAARVWELA